MQSNSKEQHVHAVFESIAPKYDLMNDLLSFRRHKAWRAFTMRKMGVKPGKPQSIYAAALAIGR